MDGKFALVEWKDTWEKASEMDGDGSAAELRRVWRQQCVREGKTTPLPPRRVAALQQRTAQEAGDEEEEDEQQEDEQEGGEDEEDEEEGDEEEGDEEEDDETEDDADESDESSGGLSDEGRQELARMLASQVCRVHDLVVCVCVCVPCS